MYDIVRNESEIDNLLADCIEAESEGTSKYPGMTFEKGIQYAIKWLTDASEPHPLED